MEENEITKHIYDNVNDDWNIIGVDVLDDACIEYELEKRDGIDFDCEMISYMKNLFKKDKFFDKYGLGLGNMPNCRFSVQVYDICKIRVWR